MSISPEQTAKFSIRGLTFAFGDKIALREINLEIPRNSITVIFGPSQAGKSVLLRTLNRLNDLVDTAALRGQVLLDGKRIYDPDVDVVALRRRVGIVFTIPIPLPGTIRENITYGLRLAGERNPQRLEEALERSLHSAALWEEVKDRLDSSAFALSGGQQQRLCLARVLALEPEVILLDNPTSGLDPISTARVEESLRVLRERYTVVMVPHSIQQGARIADQAAFLLGGELVETGGAEQIFIRPRDHRTEEYVTGRFG